MTNMSRAKRTQFTVSWPVQAVAAFRSQESELVLSWIYWHWIFEALADIRDGDRRLPFVEAVESGFNEASDIETFPATPTFLDSVRQIDPSRAPSFERLVPAEGCTVPSPDEVLAEFERVVREAVSSGTMEMEIG